MSPPNQSSDEVPTALPGVCPKCGQPKIQADNCPFCGIIFARFGSRTKVPAAALLAKSRRIIAPLGLRDMGIYARFFRQISRMIGAGKSLIDTLNQVKGGHPRLTNQVTKVVQALDRGETLVAGFAFAKARFPSFVWGHLEAGERSGRLEELLDDLACELAARRKWIMKQIFNFHTLWLVAIFGFAALSLAITESVRHLSPEDVEKGQAAILGAISMGTLSRSLIYGFFIVVAVLAFAWFQIEGKHRLTLRSPFLERLRLHIPLFGQITRLEAWRRYLRLLAKMLESGLSLPIALGLAQQDIEFPVWQRQFNLLQETLDRGGTLAQGFGQLPFAPKTLAIEIDIGEQTGSLSESLRHDAATMGEQVNQLRNLAGVVFLVASVFLGAILTIFVFARGLGAWLPIYEKVL